MRKTGKIKIKLLKSDEALRYHLHGGDRIHWKKNCHNGSVLLQHNFRMGRIGDAI
jgi:hypothetical protein